MGLAEPQRRRFGLRLPMTTVPAAFMHATIRPSSLRKPSVVRRRAVRAWAGSSVGSMALLQGLRRLCAQGLTALIADVNMRIVYMRNQLMNISDAEAQVMTVLWGLPPQSTEEIAPCKGSLALQDRQDWQLATIETLLNCLLNKGAISAEKEGAALYLYGPTLQREAWLQGQSLGLLDRLFGGDLAPLVAQFSAERRLSPADPAALKQLIREHEKNDDD